MKNKEIMKTYFIEYKIYFDLILISSELIYDTREVF